MGNKKMFPAVFAYDFELLHKINEILALARMKSANADEIFGFASDEIKSTHPASSRISSDRREDFIIEDDFTHPQGRI